MSSKKGDAQQTREAEDSDVKTTSSETKAPRSDNQATSSAAKATSSEAKAQSSESASKSVKFQTSVGSTESKGFSSKKRQSLKGTAGYITQLVEELETDDTPIDDEVKPVRSQTALERRETVKLLASDMTGIMKEVSGKSSEKLPTLAPSRDKISEVTSAPKMDAAEIADLSTTEWLPSEILGDKHGDKVEKSWVGTYIVGKDYRTPKDKLSEEAAKIKLKSDEKRTPWYEAPVTAKSGKDDKFFKLKQKTRATVDALKDEMDAEYREQKLQRLISAAAAREEPKKDIQWSDQFKSNFRDVAKDNVHSHGGTHMSMADADRWLEKADILDHKYLTLVHTGFCFLACGGSRYRGLSFTEFTNYLGMVSYITGMPLREVTKRMEVCLRRKPGEDSE